MLTKLRSYRKLFQERFDLLHKFENQFKIFTWPFEFEIEETPEILQLELIDLQTSTELKHIFRRIYKLQFYSEYVEEGKLLNLKQMATRVAAAIGPTYLCESFFRS